MITPKRAYFGIFVAFILRNPVAQSGAGGKLVFCLLTSFFFGTYPVFAQKSSTSAENSSTAIASGQSKVVVITGARFCYPLVQKWIDDYTRINPEAQIVIEARGSADPAKYDILVEVFEPDEIVKKNNQYIHVARYPVLPVANSKSRFAKVYADKGLNQDLIRQLYFHDAFADKEKEIEIKAPYTIYTRLQKAGAPIVFTRYFGFEQKDIKGKAIAGADEHLLKAILRDTTAVSYLPLPLIFDRGTGLPFQGLTVLPVDLTGNNRVNEDEKFYANAASVIRRLESEESKSIHNLPIGNVHLSINKTSASPESIEFLRWVISNGQKDIHDFGYLVPEPGRFELEKLDWLVTEKNKQ